MKMRKKTANKKNTDKKDLRLTIGLLLDNVDDDYQRIIWAGVEQTAKEADVNVVCFLSGDFKPEDKSARLHNEIFKLISPFSLNGLIVASTVLATFIGNERLSEYCKRFQPLPMVSIGFQLQGITNVQAENQLGFRSIMNHLIEDHGYRKFLYIGGPKTNQDAAERQRIFESALQAHNIMPDPALITQADFYTDAAYRIVLDALNKKREFEAVVSANDGMAIAAMKALRDRNIIIPDQVAVTGFDDIRSARHLFLPLTTVRQPTFEMSKRAAEILLQKIRGEPVPDLELFKTKVIIRRSCGCLSHETGRVAPSGKDTPKNASKPGFDSIKTSLLHELNEHNGPISQNFITPFVEDVIDAFQTELSIDTQSNIFLPRLDKALHRSWPAGMDDMVWGNTISSLRKIMLPYLRTNPDQLIKAENMLHQARIMIKDMAKHFESDKRLRLADTTKTLQYVIDTFIGSFDVPTLMDNLAVELPRIGIKSCYLSVHTAAEKIYKIACLLLAYNENGRIPLGKTGYMYTARHLLPKEVVKLKRRYNIIFQPLIFRQEQMGFVGLEFNPLEEISSLALSELIRSSLKASMMMQEIIEKDKKLSDLDRLKNDFIANITHDFRSHLTVILNSARLGLMSDTKEHFNEVIDRYNIIYEASVKLKQTIDRLLDLAKMDALGIKLRIQKLGLKAYIENIINFYKSATASSGVTIQSRLPEHEIEDFYTDVDKLEEILHNLVSNALKFVDPRKGIITISLLNKATTVEIRVRDNGIGIPRDKLEIIFGRFEQLDEHHNNRYAGTGIGLAFAKELTRYLRGSIRAESEGPGKGACFILEFKKGTEAFYDLSIDSQNANEPSDLSKRSQLKKIIKSNIKDSLQKEEIQTFFPERNRENEYDPKKGVILIVDDDEPIRAIVKEYLEKAGYMNFITATNGRDAIDAVYKYGVDLIISDYNMPKMRGDEMQDIIASNPYLKQTPVLFLTVMTDKRIIQERKEKGVLTFLTKPIDEKEFLVSVDIHMRRHMEYLQLLNQAPLDSLTGLANRTTIMVSLEDLLMLRVYRHLSVILFDLDDFTALNKEFGYRSGDAILADAGRIIKDSLRGYYRAGRYNAQEFLIILPETTLEQAHSYAEKLRHTIESTQITARGKKITLSASLGISSLIDNGGYICSKLNIEDLKAVFEMNLEESTDWRGIQKIKQDIKNLLLEMAQRAMSHAKKTGKNKTVGFTELQEME